MLEWAQRVCVPRCAQCVSDNCILEWSENVCEPSCSRCKFIGTAPYAAIARRTQVIPAFAAACCVLPTFLEDFSSYWKRIMKSLWILNEVELAQRNPFHAKLSVGHSSTFVNLRHSGSSKLILLKSLHIFYEFVILRINCFFFAHFVGISFRFSTRSVFLLRQTQIRRMSTKTELATWRQTLKYSRKNCANE